MGVTPTYDLYIDDSGSRDPDHDGDAGRRDRLDAFALGGVLLPAEKSFELAEKVRAFCVKLEITYPLHSTEIRCRKSNFRWVEQDKDRTQRLYEGLAEIVAGLPGWVTAAVVDRPGYNARYKDKYGGKRWPLCETAYQILIERAAKVAANDGRRLKVFVAQTGKREDCRIREYHRALLEKGMGFSQVTSSAYKPMTPADFQSVLIKNPHFVTSSNALVQVADLVLYPVVKGGYDPNYRPYRQLLEHTKLIDCRLSDALANCGVKYSCFDEPKQKPDPQTGSGFARCLRQRQVAIDHGK